MGARGPAPTPSNVLAARGSWRAKLNRREPAPEPGAPVCPRPLGDAEKKVWRALCRVLSEMDVLTKADGSILERYAIYFVRWRACEEFVRKNGTTYPLKRQGPAAVNGVTPPPRFPFVGRLASGEYVVGWFEFPQVRESHRLHRDLKEIEDRFGLSPAARTRIRTITEQGPKLHDGDESESAGRARKFFGNG